MHFNYRNVNDAFRNLVHGVHTGSLMTDVEPSRNGEVLRAIEPTLLTYSHPRERVLFNTVRDANCFFHLFEALWMLAGRNDVAPLAYYNSRMASFSDDGKTFNGAYGYRWRKATARVARGRAKVEQWRTADFEPGEVLELKEELDVDQLAVLIEHLKANPYSRRAVLTMWNVEDDLLKIGEPCAHCVGREPRTPSSYKMTHPCRYCGGSRMANQSKDVCCNTHIYFSVESGVCPACLGTGSHSSMVGLMSDDGYHRCEKCGGTPSEQPRYLNMTVCNRSNDLVWGLLGANYVHFSILQEYLAAHIGLDVGSYNHFTNNLHVYTERWEPEKWLVDSSENWYLDVKQTVPLVSDPATFDRELPLFVQENRNGGETPGGMRWDEPFLDRVAQPLLHAFHMHKARDYDAAEYWIKRVAADDWRIAGANWIAKRRRLYESNHPVPTSEEA